MIDIQFSEFSTCCTIHVVFRAVPHFFLRFVSVINKINDLSTPHKLLGFIRCIINIVLYISWHSCLLKNKRSTLIRRWLVSHFIEQSEVFKFKLRFIYADCDDLRRTANTILVPEEISLNIFITIQFINNGNYRSDLDRFYLKNMPSYTGGTNFIINMINHMVIKIKWLTLDYVSRCKSLRFITNQHRTAFNDQTTTDYSR